MFTAFIAIIRFPSRPMSVKPVWKSSWHRLTCFLAWLIPAVMVVQDRPLVLQGPVCVHLVFGVSAIQDPPAHSEMERNAQTCGWVQSLEDARPGVQCVGEWGHLHLPTSSSPISLKNEVPTALSQCLPCQSAPSTPHPTAHGPDQGG